VGRENSIFPNASLDTVRLPKAYFQAGVREYWLIDARGEELSFQLLRRGDGAFEPTPADADGYQRSMEADIFPTSTTVEGRLPWQPSCWKNRSRSPRYRIWLNFAAGYCRTIFRRVGGCS